MYNWLEFLESKESLVLVWCFCSQLKMFKYHTKIFFSQEIQACSVNHCCQETNLTLASMVSIVKYQPHNSNKIEITMLIYEYIWNLTIWLKKTLRVKTVHAIFWLWRINNLTCILIVYKKQKLYSFPFVFIEILNTT